MRRGAWLKAGGTTRLYGVHANYASKRHRTCAIRYKQPEHERAHQEHEIVSIWGRISTPLACM